MLLKALAVLSVLIVCTHSQLDIPKQFHAIKGLPQNQELLGGELVNLQQEAVVYPPLPGGPVAVAAPAPALVAEEPTLIAAPAPALVEAAPIQQRVPAQGVVQGFSSYIPGQYIQQYITQLRAQPQLNIAAQEVAVAPAPVAIASPPLQLEEEVHVRAVEQVSAPIAQPIHTVYTQQIIPTQDLETRAGPQVLHVRSKGIPVIVHFQSESTPVQIEQSHIPGPPGEVTFTRSEDEPHRVIHEVVRPVIQEVREVIQPFRQLTQEVRPVEERVHTNVASGAGVARAPAPALVAAPIPAVLGATAQRVVPAQGVVQGFSSYTPGQYIQQYITQFRNQPQLALPAQAFNLAPAPAPVVLPAPVPVVAPAPAPIAQVVEQVEQPIAVEAVQTLVTQPVIGAQRVATRGGNIVSFNRKYVEYTN